MLKPSRPVRTQTSQLYFAEFPSETRSWPLTFALVFSRWSSACFLASAKDASSCVVRRIFSALKSSSRCYSNRKEISRHQILNVLFVNRNHRIFDATKWSFRWQVVAMKFYRHLGNFALLKQCIGHALSCCGGKIVLVHVSHSEWLQHFIAGFSKFNLKSQQFPTWLCCKLSSFFPKTPSSSRFWYSDSDAFL